MILWGLRSEEWRRGLVSHYQYHDILYTEREGGGREGRQVGGREGKEGRDQIVGRRGKTVYWWLTHWCMLLWWTCAALSATEPAHHSLTSEREKTDGGHHHLTSHALSHNVQEQGYRYLSDNTNQYALYKALLITTHCWELGLTGITCTLLMSCTCSTTRSLLAHNHQVFPCRVPHPARLVRANAWHTTSIQSCV